MIRVSDGDTERARAPRQERSRRTLGRIVTSARLLLAEGGIGAVTVHSVVASAPASVGSFYARFAGKEDLLEHLQKEVWGEVRAWWDAEDGGTEWEALSLEAAVARAVELLQGSLGVLAAERRALGARPEGVAAEEAFAHRARQALCTRILAHRDQILHSDPDLAVDLGVRAVHGALLGLERNGTAEVEPARARGELTRLFVFYLGDGAAGRGQGSARVDFFDVWG
jgi:AcrR family transcriptional regulator